MKQVLVFGVLTIGISGCRTDAELHSQSILGIWIMEQAPAGLPLVSEIATKCQSSTEFRSDNIMVSRSGEALLEASYTVRAHESGYMITSHNTTHNGKPNCQGLSMEFVMQHSVDETYIEVTGDQMKFFVSPDNRNQFFTLRKQR